jgi:hypothetical protein
MKPVLEICTCYSSPKTHVHVSNNEQAIEAKTKNLKVIHANTCDCVVCTHEYEGMEGL